MERSQETLAAIITVVVIIIIVANFLLAGEAQYLNMTGFIIYEAFMSVKI